MWFVFRNHMVIAVEQFRLFRIFFFFQAACLLPCHSDLVFKLCSLLL